MSVTKSIYTVLIGLLLTVSTAFAIDIDKAGMDEFNELEKSYKFNKHSLHVCKEVKKTKNGKKKKVIKKIYKHGRMIRKVKRIVWVDENGKKTFKAPIKLVEIENDNPNLLTIEMDSKDIKNGTKEKFTPHKAKYKVFEPSENFKGRSGKITAELYEVEGKKRFNVNLTDLVDGNYQLFVRIVSNKTVHLERREKKKNKKKKHRKKLKNFVHFASIDFTKVHAESANAVLTRLGFHPTGSRVRFDMSESFSSTSEITKYIVTLFKDGVPISSSENLVSAGTIINYVFSDFGVYQVQLEVFDEEDSDIALSEEIIPINTAPVIIQKLTQNPSYSDVYEIDFAGTHVLDGSGISYYGVRVYQNGQVVDELFSGDEVMNFQITARGEFSLIAFVGSDSGSFELQELELNYIAPEVPVTLVLEYAYQYVDSEDPRLLYVGFKNQISEEEFSHFNVTVTDLANDEQASYKSYSYIFTDMLLNALVGIRYSGQYRFDIQLELKDGTLSVPFDIEHTFDFDLGEPALNVNITEVEGSPRTYLVSSEGSTPGNYGQVSESSCEVSNSASGTTFTQDLMAGDVEISLTELGEWNFSCTLKTTLNLTATFETKIQINNKLPIASVSIERVNPNQRFYKFTTSSSDVDGHIVAGILSITNPEGVVTNLDIQGVIEQELVNSGGYQVVYKVQDNDGAWSEDFFEEVIVENVSPVSSFTITAIDVIKRQYEFNATYSDSDGSIKERILSITKPSGLVENVSVENKLELSLSEVGSYSFSFHVVDNEGASSTINSKQILISNSAPVATLSVTEEDAIARKYKFSTSATDSDGTIERVELQIIDPAGEVLNFDTSGELYLTLNRPGTYSVTFKAIDNDGRWSETKTATQVIFNISPIATISITPANVISRDYRFLVGGTDPDGYVIRGELEVVDPIGGVQYFELNGDVYLKLSLPGTYTANYRVLDNNDVWSELVSQTQVIVNLNPIANIIIEKIGYRKVLITDNSFDSDGSISHTVAIIHSPEGEVVTVDFSNSYEFDITSDGAWIFNVSSVDNEGGFSDEVSKVIISTGVKPIAKITTDKTLLFVGEEVVFRASESTAPFGGDLIYRWIIEDVEYNTEVVEHVFTTIGEKIISLEVFDTLGNSGKEDVLLLVEHNPGALDVVEITVGGEVNKDGSFNGRIGFGLGASDLNGNKFSSIRWDMGDGAIYDDVIFLNHRFLKTGTKFIRVDIVTTNGAVHSIGKTIEIMELESNYDKDSQFFLDVSGVDLEGFNPTLLTVGFHLLGEGLFTNYEVILNGKSVTDHFNKTGLSIISGAITASEGVNSLTLLARDQNGHKVEKYLDFKSGSRVQTIQYVDDVGRILPNFPLSISMENGEKQKVVTDLDGKIYINNLPSSKLLIYGTNELYYSSRLIESEEAIVVIAADLISVGGIQNNDFSNDLLGWIYDARYSNISGGEDDKFLSVIVPDGIHTQISHTYESVIDGLFLENAVEFNIQFDYHDILVTQINHSSGEIFVELVNINSEQKIEQAVFVKKGDVVTYKVEYYPRNLISSVEVYLGKLFSAYASGGTLGKIKKSKYGTFKLTFRLKDLNWKVKKPEGVGPLKLTDLFRVSVGSYGNENENGEGVNNIYIEGTIKNGESEANIVFSNLLVKQGDEVASASFKNVPWRNKQDPMVISSYDSIDRDGDQTKASTFLPFIEIKNNQFDGHSKVRITFTVTAHDPNTNKILYYKNYLVSRSVLVDHGLRGKDHYCHDSEPKKECSNIALPDNGDDWSTDLVSRVVNELAKSKFSFKVGDVSNANGHFPGQSYFQPHSGHYDGKKFDSQTVNFHSLSAQGQSFDSSSPSGFSDSNTGFGAGGIFELTQLLKHSTLFRENLVKFVVTEIDNSASTKLYENTCISGLRTIDIMSPDVGHGGHHHFQISKDQDDDKFIFKDLKEFNSTVSLANGYPMFPDEEGSGGVPIKKVMKYLISGENLGVMVQLFEVSSSNKYTEILNLVYTQSANFTTADGALTLKKKVNTNEFTVELNLKRPAGTSVFEWSEAVKNVTSKYIVNVNGVEKEALPEFGYQRCFQHEIDFLNLDDCNLDGLKNDPAVKTKDGGVIAIDPDTALPIVLSENLVVAEGARVCGRSRLLAPAGFINGPNTLLEDVEIGKHCSWVSIEGRQNNPDTGTDEYGAIRIRNSHICTEETSGDNTFFTFTSNSKFNHEMTKYRDIFPDNVFINEKYVPTIEDSLISPNTFFGQSGSIISATVKGNIGLHRTIIDNSGKEQIAEKQIYGHLYVLDSFFKNSLIKATEAPDTSLGFPMGMQIRGARVIDSTIVGTGNVFTPVSPGSYTDSPTKTFAGVEEYEHEGYYQNIISGSTFGSEDPPAVILDYYSSVVMGYGLATGSHLNLRSYLLSGAVQSGYSKNYSVVSQNAVLGGWSVNESTGEVYGDGTVLNPPLRMNSPTSFNPLINSGNVYGGSVVTASGSNTGEIVNSAIDDAEEFTNSGTLIKVTFTDGKELFNLGEIEDTSFKEGKIFFNTGDISKLEITADLQNTGTISNTTFGGDSSNSGEIKDSKISGKVSNQGIIDNVTITGIYRTTGTDATIKNSSIAGDVSNGGSITNNSALSGTVHNSSIIENGKVFGILYNGGTFSNATVSSGVLSIEVGSSYVGAVSFGNSSVTKGACFLVLVDQSCVNGEIPKKEEGE